jgi:hypothetical protein
MGYLGYKPADKPLTAADIADSIITSAKIVDATITNSDVASSIITGQTAETSIADADTLLIYDDSATALRKITKANFVSGIGGANTPAFVARVTTIQSLANDTFVKVQFNSENFDTASAFDSTTNYRFTVPSGQGGRYFIYSIITLDSDVNSNMDTALIDMYKNGSSIASVGTEFIFRNNPPRYNPVMAQIIIDLVATDYIEIFARIEATDSTGGRVLGGLFGGYKLIS